MNIELEFEIEKDIDGKIEIVIEKRKFSSIRMRGRALKRMLSIQDIMVEAERNNIYTEEHYDLMIEFIVDMFGNKFTSEELLDGMDLEDVHPLFKDIMETIASKTMSKVENLIKN